MRPGVRPSSGRLSRSCIFATDGNENVELLAVAVGSNFSAAPDQMSLPAATDRELDKKERLCRGQLFACEARLQFQMGLEGTSS